VKGSSVTAGAAAVVDVAVPADAAVVVVVDVVVVVSCARSGREVASAMDARADRVLNRAACPAGCIFIWCLGVEVITEGFLEEDLAIACRVAMCAVPSRLR
jgi:hypothetical protein